METETQVVQDNESAAPATETTQAAPQTTQEAAPDATRGARDAATPSEVVAEAFTPNWKFKVMDKEHEIPEWARAGVKDATLEKQAREVFEKAYGLDVVKPKFQEVRKQYQDLNQKHTDVMASIDQARQHFQKGDLESFFNHMSIPEEQVLKYFIDKAKLMEAPPEQQRAYQMQRDAERRAEQAEQQAQQVQNSYAARLKDETIGGLQSEFSKPEVSGFAKQFDTRLGKEGAFFEEVVRRGDFHWKSGRYVPPQQVVAEVLQLGGYSPAAAATAAGVQPGQSTAAPSQVVKPAASIPAINGRQTAPMPQKPRSIEDLEAIRKSKYGS